MLRRACHVAVAALSRIAAPQAAKRWPKRASRCTGGTQTLRDAALHLPSSVSLQYTVRLRVCRPGIAPSTQFCQSAGSR